MSETLSYIYIYKYEKQKLLEFEYCSKHIQNGNNGHKLQESQKIHLWQQQPQIPEDKEAMNIIQSYFSVRSQTGDI